MSGATTARCLPCRLRFASADAAYLTACPRCGDALEPITDLQQVFGFALFTPEPQADSLPDAIAVSLPAPVPDPNSLQI
jgi:hypothetical protein